MADDRENTKGRDRNEPEPSRSGQPGGVNEPGRSGSDQGRQGSGSGSNYPGGSTTNPRTGSTGSRTPGSKEKEENTEDTE